MMKRAVVIGCLAAVLAAIGIGMTGCCSFFDHQDKTAAEVNRDHLRVLRIQNQQIWEDVDKALLMDKPSKLTDKRVP